MATGTPSHKVILCGEYGVGKSSIFRRYMDNSYTQASGPSSTVGLDHFAKTVRTNNQQVKMELWDTAGIERFATLSSSYFQSTSAAILVYALNDRMSFNTLSQHILEIVMHTDTAKIFLCGNKSDLNEDEVTDTDIRDFRVQCDKVLSGVYKISCKTGHGVREMFEDIGHVLLRDSSDKFASRNLQPLPREQASLEEKGQCCTTS